MIGSIAGYLRGRVDFWLMRVVDVLLAFPGILLAIALSAVLGPHILNTVVALSLIGWTGYARLVRIEVLAIMQRPHVEAARALGTPPLRLVVHHILPIVAVPIAIQATFSLAAAIVAEASLSFLGLGVQPPTPSWGSMINESRGFILIAPHLAVIPGIALFVTVLALNAVGEGFRQRLNVRSGIRSKRARLPIADTADSKNWTAAPRRNA
jgi:peptide/nickel transport system permease protein